MKKTIAIVSFSAMLIVGCGGSTEEVEVENQINEVEAINTSEEAELMEMEQMKNDINESSKELDELLNDL